MMRFALTEENRELTLSIATLLALPLALVVLIPGVVGIFLVNRESSHRDAQAAEQRAEIKRAFTITLINQCNEIERLKHGFRQKATSDYHNLSQTLALLKIERTPQITQAARKSRDKVLRLYRPIPGGSYFDDRGRIRWRGCGRYPPPLG